MGLVISPVAFVSDKERRKFAAMQGSVRKYGEKKELFQGWLSPTRYYLGHVHLGSGLNLNRWCWPKNRTVDDLPSTCDWALVKVDPPRERGIM